MTPDVLLTIAVARVFERTLSIAVAGLCIWLGWRLFYLDAAAENSEVSISAKRLKLSLKRVGPGVIFSLFGAIIVSLSYINPVTVQVHDEVSSTQEEKHDQPPSDALSMKHEELFNGLDSSSDLKTKKTAQAINRIIQLLDQPKLESNVMKARVMDLISDLNTFKALRDSIVTRQLGTKSVYLWKQYGESYESDPLSLSQKDRDALSEIAPWFSARLDNAN